MRRLLLATALLLPSASAIAQSQCQATNDSGDQFLGGLFGGLFEDQCAASCPVPQAAVCLDGVGPESPLCMCVGAELPNPARQAGGGRLQQDGGGFGGGGLELDE